MKLLLISTFTIVLSLSLSAQDISVDKKLGAENALLVEQEIGLYQHDSLYKLVNKVGNKLVSRLTNNPFEFKFFLADSPEPNAFALPGGYVYVTRGILLLVQTEDELAGIISHEIIHVSQRHSIKQMKKGRLAGILQIPGNIINSVTGTRLGNIINTPIALTRQAFISNYSRGHEREADSYGAVLAANAGYNPNALADALERLGKGVEILTGNKEKRNYFSDHPLTSSRTADIRQANAAYKSADETQEARSKEEFQQKFNGLCFGPNPKQGVFIDSLFIHPDLGFSWISPTKWKTANKPSSVAVYTEKGDAIAVLNAMDNSKSVKEIGEEARNNALKSKSVIVTSARDTTINSNKAYLMRLKDADPRSSVLLEVMWIAFEDNVFQLAGVFTPPNAKVVHQTLSSFRKSSEGELKMVNLFELQTVHSKKSETISQLSERTSNKLNLSLTALINDLKQESSLDENTIIKIIRGVPYQSVSRF
jgi:predicted Zn-dependent protease